MTITSKFTTFIPNY